MKINELPNFERPYERLEKYGPEVLSDAELIAIILKTGSGNKSSVELAQSILKENEYSELGLRFLNTVSIKELTKFKGIGRVKAITLKAVGEIVKRMERPLSKNVSLNKTSEVAKLLMPELRYEKIEKFSVIFLDTKNHLEKIKYYTEFRENEISVPLKEIFREAVKENSRRILLAHNHPSGDPTPSKQDIIFTKQIIEIAKVLEIEVLDHIVIGDGIYVSIMPYI